MGLRLQASKAALAIPDAPATVVAAASTLWREALSHAFQHSQSSAAGAREAAAAEQLKLTELRDVLDQEKADFARTKGQLEARLLNLERQLEELRTHLGDARSSLEQARAEKAWLTTELGVSGQRATALERSLAEATTRAADERAQLLASEGRWAAEVDRLRVQIKAIEKERTGEQRAHRASEQAAAQALKEAVREKTEAQKSAAAVKAVVASLEARLDHAATTGRPLASRAKRNAKIGREAPKPRGRART